jgi:hypothetical protein
MALHDTRPDVHWGWLNPVRFDGEKMVPMTLLCDCPGDCRDTPPSDREIRDVIEGRRLCRMVQ